MVKGDIKLDAQKLEKSLVDIEKQRIRLRNTEMKEVRKEV